MAAMRTGTASIPSLRTRVKGWLPFWLTTAIARAINRPWLEPEHRCERLWEYAWVLNNVRGPRIADVGYASSYLAEALCLFGDVDGVDPRDEPRIVHPRFRRLPAGRLSADTYDTIVCISVLEHLSRPVASRLVGEMYAALVPGGQALLTVPCGNEGPFRGYNPFTTAEIQRWPGYVEHRAIQRAWRPNTEHEVTCVALVRLVHPGGGLGSVEAIRRVRDNASR